MSRGAINLAFDVRLSWSEKKGKILFTTLQEYAFQVGEEEIRIPSGFETDFATVPRVFWSLFPPLGKHNPAALVHDYLYVYKIGTRERADFIFLFLMLQYGVNPIKAVIMYLAVRLGGGKWWKKQY